MVAFTPQASANEPRKLFPAAAAEQTFIVLRNFSKASPGQRFLVLLFPEHDGVIKIENHVRVESAEEREFERRKADGLEKDDDVVPARRPKNSELRGHPRALRGENRRFNAETLIGRQTILQPKPDTRRVAMFDYAKDTHFRSEGIRFCRTDGRRFDSVW